MGLVGVRMVVVVVVVGVSVFTKLILWVIVHLYTTTEIFIILQLYKTHLGEDRERNKRIE